MGEVGARGAVIWSRTDRPARMQLVLQRSDDPSAPAVFTGEIPVDGESDHAGRIALEDLEPATSYRATVRFSAPGAADPPGRPATARFRTAPLASEPAAVRLAWGGGLAGQGICRDAREGFPIFDRILAERPDVFVGLGDMIYADDVCHPVGPLGNAQIPGEFGPATDLDGFRAHWRYVRDDDGLRRLLAHTPYVAIWDDHEIISDAGPHHDTRAEPPYRAHVPLLPLARRAFQEWNPLADGQSLHRRLRWGRHLELFALDTRQYRDPNLAPDDGAEPKTMLGAGQRRWLEHAVASSDATWKVIASSVPISIPTGSLDTGRDGWADLGQHGGFERELLGILESFRDHGVRNLVWITTGVHFAAAFRYRPFVADRRFRFFEIATGPLHAGLYRNELVDATFSPQRLFLFAPPKAHSVSSLDEAKRWFNFGILDVSEDGKLAARVVNGEGEEVFRLTLPPQRTR
ncbi:alkaline phosphatase D family protein [Myxococcota bacterium]|nr:alkaline phosphatase D family protein [Myxococcota bacterium]MCZ7618008.1 alkaline phosphatase D family protein [Myxococcota bacterium]